MLLLFIKAVHHSLNVPGIAVKPLIKAVEQFSREATLLGLKESAGKIKVDFLMQGIQLHKLCALIKGPLGRAKHLLHQMLLAAREDEPDVMHELNV